MGEDSMKTLLLLFALGQAPTPTDLVDQMQALLEQLRTAIAPAPVDGPVVLVPAAANLQAALDAATPGTTLKLAAGATYTGNFILRAKAGPGVITVTTTGTLPAGRIRPGDAAQLPKLQAPVGGDAALATAPGAHHWSLVGLEVLGNPGGFGDLVRLGDGSDAQRTLDQVPHDLVVDRCYIHGDPTVGQKRGLALNAAATTITRSYISDIKAVGQDSQAIAGWNGPGPYTITDNYLEAAGENVLFGGSDPAIPNLVPSDITITGNLMVKPLAWRGGPWSIKNIFELKSARRVLVEGNTLSNVWGHAQVGYAVVLTPRNQDGRAPWSTIEDVIFRTNRIEHAAAGINILGTDYTNPSQRMARIQIIGNTFTDIDPVAYGGSDKVFLVSDGPIDVTIDGNTITGKNIGSILYFSGSPKSLRFKFTNNRYPTSEYGIFGASSSTGGNPPRAWVDYVEGGTISGNVVTP
jgi:hypothetical protein